MTKIVEPTYEIEDEVLDRVEQEEDCDWNEEPDETQLKEVVQEELNTWSIITCVYCKGKFDLVTYHRFDSNGQVLCPHCRRGN